MSATCVNSSNPDLVSYQTTFLEENSTFRKGISYIPILGIFPSFVQEISLAGKILRGLN